MEKEIKEKSFINILGQEIFLKDLSEVELKEYNIWKTLEEMSKDPNVCIRVTLGNINTNDIKPKIIDHDKIRQQEYDARLDNWLKNLKKKNKK